MAIETNISAVDVNSASYAAKTTVVGQEEVPTLSVAEMQTSVEYMPRNLLAPKINELVNAVNASYSKAETDAAINAKVSEIGTGDMAKAVYDASGTVQAAGGIAGYVDGQVRAVDGKLNNLQNAIRYITVVLWPDRWEGNSAPYTYTIPVSGMTANFVPGIPWLKGFADIATDDLKHRLEEMRKIQRIDTTDGKVIITCLEEKPDHVLDLCIPGEVDSGTIYDPYA